ncbi:hypothetical protein [Streptomyces sp. NPDC090080]|uniref:hypothetical protein n=1 Tax=Streptomyces sp. NPDC090080 TaxID=3365939 RepID=UPI003827FF33
MALARSAIRSIRAPAGSRRQQQLGIRRRCRSTVLIPGTSSLTHLQDNVAPAGLTLPADAVAALDAISK